MMVLVGVCGCGRTQENPAPSGSEPLASTSVSSTPTQSVSRELWLVQQKQDQLTDKATVIGTVALTSAEAGRYEFSIVLDGSQDLRGNEVATLRAAIFDAEPTGLTTLGMSSKMVKSGTSRLDQAAPSRMMWVQSEEFRNLFTTQFTAKELAGVRNRILVTGLRAADEVFELRRDGSSDSLWEALENRAKAADNRKMEAVEKAEAIAIARIPGLNGNPTNQRFALSPDAAVQQGASKLDVYQTLGAPVMAAQAATISEWHYCETGEFSSHRLRTIFFVDGGVVGDVRYSAPYSDDCTEKVKAGSYTEPEAITALRTKQ